nr:MAG TPA: hypothetical protein [Caudoviricetes sp.]
MNQARKFTLILGGFSCLVFSVRVWGHHCAGAGWIATARTGEVSRGAKPLWLWVIQKGRVASLLAKGV